MKSLVLIAISFSIANATDAQVLKRLGDRAKQKVEQKAGDKVDKTIDDATDGSSKKKVETEEGEVKVKKDGDETKVKTEAKGEGIKSYSKYDFIPGDKIIYAENFDQDVIGEFPLKWNTDGSGEVVTINKYPGKWLQLKHNTNYYSPFKAKLPENFTVEFDMLMDYKESMNLPDLFVKLITKSTNDHYPAGFILRVEPQGGNYNEGSADRMAFDSWTMDAKRHLEGKDVLHAQFANNKNRPVHISMWVQKERVRIWVNDQKLYDLPKALPAGIVLDQLAFELPNYGGSTEYYSYYLSNIKIAVATPDTRSKLITEGKWSTTGITFDVNSDKIKPASYAVLKEIAATLNENPTVRVKIIGHTDSDGDDAANLDLSKRRAASVRIALTTEFGIDGSRFETDGLGETKPVSDNKSPEAKAQNRRVEFIKL